MQVKWQHSISFKLFALISSVTLLTVIVVSGHNLLKFRNILQSQISEKTINLSESSHQSIENLFHMWRGVINQIMLRSANLSDKELEALLRETIHSNKDFVSFHMIEKNEKEELKTVSFSFTKDKNSPHFEDKDPDEVMKSIESSNMAWIKLFLKKPDHPLYIKNASKEAGISLVRMAVPAITGKKGVRWGILTTWQQPVTGILTSDKFLHSYLVDDQATILVSPKIDDVIKNSDKSSVPIVKLALRGASKSGSEEFKNEQGEARLGAFSWSEDLRFATIFIRDPKLAYLAINKEVTNIILITILVLLIVVLISYHGAGQITSNLKRLTVATQSIAGGKFGDKIHLKSNDEIHALGASINEMSVKIQDLLKSTVAAARQEKELETAKVVQQTLFPKHEIAANFFAVTGTYFPASECGGDWWGHFSTDDDFEFICIADATGHGAAAALVTAIAYSSCMTIARIYRTENEHQQAPERLLSLFNKVLWEAGNGVTTMTFFAAFINKKSGVMTYANAGHNHPVLIPESIGDARLANKEGKEKKYIILSNSGSPLGMVPDSTYVSKKINLCPGDKLFLYTDGLIECKNPKGEMWGKKRMIKEIESLSNLDIATIRDGVTKSAFGFFDSHPMEDDITVVVAEMKKDWTPPLALQPS